MGKLGFFPKSFIGFHIFANLVMVNSFANFMDFGVPTDDIKNCQFNPYVCALLCGTANPSCAMTGHCSCHHRPSEDCNCKAPTVFEFGKCNEYICQRKGTTAAVCTVNQEKYCVCAPIVRNERSPNSSINVAFAELKLKDLMFL